MVPCRSGSRGRGSRTVIDNGENTRPSEKCAQIILEEQTVRPRLIDHAAGHAQQERPSENETEAVHNEFHFVIVPRPNAVGNRNSGSARKIQLPSEILCVFAPLRDTFRRGRPNAGFKEKGITQRRKDAKEKTDRTTGGRRPIPLKAAPRPLVSVKTAAMQRLIVTGGRERDCRRMDCRVGLL